MYLGTLTLLTHKRIVIPMDTPNMWEGDYELFWALLDRDLPATGAHRDPAGSRISPIIPGIRTYTNHSYENDCQ